MNVKDLKSLINDLPDDMEVIIQKDSEGNGYSPLSGCDPDSIYIPENTWSGECYFTEWSAEDVDMESDEWDKLKEDNKRSLVLYPVN